MSLIAVACIHFMGNGHRLLSLLRNLTHSIRASKVILNEESHASDVPLDNENAHPFQKLLAGMHFNFFINDDHCESFIRFAKGQSEHFLPGLNSSEHVCPCCGCGHNFHKFCREEILTCLLAKSACGLLHSLVADSAFEGDSGCWGIRFNCSLNCTDQRCKHSVNANSLQMQGLSFPIFADIAN